MQHNQAANLRNPRFYVKKSIYFDVIHRKVHRRNLKLKYLNSMPDNQYYLSHGLMSFLAVL